MSKLSKQAFFLLIFAPTANAFLWGLLSDILGILFTPVIIFASPGICDNGLTALQLEDVLDCGCSGGYENFGITGTVDCFSKDATCLGANNTLCAKPGFGATFTAGGDGVSGGIGACFGFDEATGLPPEIPSDFSAFVGVEPLCLSTETGDGLDLKTCTVKLGDESCECEICDPETESGYFRYNCSTIDLGKNFPEVEGVDIVPFIPGPASDGCVGLAFNPF